jgi:succinate dehydrogenase / fumarate reductase iron-sulfur subunit
MPEYTLRIRRYNPETGEAPYWDQYTVELEKHEAVLTGILQVKNRHDGSLGVRCSCRSAICGSCGMRINGQPGLACNTQVGDAVKKSKDGSIGLIEIEPMGNMPVIKDLIVDMDAVHWKKVGRVTPWLLAKQPVPEREYIVPRESMVDITQTMACIQCGSCVSDCLAMEADPDFIGPAALAKAYRFIGDPRDAQHKQRLQDLADDPAGLYTCTHCFKCIDACPKDVAPMSQIMRLRRLAGQDHHIEDVNNGERHEQAFVVLVKKYGLLAEADIVPRSYGGNGLLGGKASPKSAQQIAESLPFLVKAVLRGKVKIKDTLIPHRLAPEDRAQIKTIFETVKGREQRNELNLYITGYDEDGEAHTELASDKEGATA